MHRLSAFIKAKIMDADLCLIKLDHCGRPRPGHQVGPQGPTHSLLCRGPPYYTTPPESSQTPGKFVEIRRMITASFQPTILQYPNNYLNSHLKCSLELILLKLV